MTTSSEKRLPDLPSLTGLRFWAAFSILLNHLLLGFVARENPYIGNMLAMCGILGMNVFFVLSGFIIHYNYHRYLVDFKWNSFFNFMVARFSRLYPLYILFIAIELFTFYGFNRYTTMEILKSIPYFLTFSQSWFYIPVGGNLIMPVMYDRASISWSISTEFLMYCGYPIILFLILKDKLSLRMKIAMVIAIWLACALGMRHLINDQTILDDLGRRIFGPESTISNGFSSSFFYWVTGFSPYFRFFEFIMGVLAAHLFLSLRDRPIGQIEGLLMPMVGLACLAFILGTFVPVDMQNPTFRWLFKILGYYPFIAVLIFVCARYDFSVVTRIFEIRFFVFFGEVSYSMYLIHIFFYGMVAITVVPGPLAVLQILMLWTMVFACSYILYVLLEMPARRWVRDLLTRRPKVPATATA